MCGSQQANYRERKYFEGLAGVCSCSDSCEQFDHGLLASGLTIEVPRLTVTEKASCKTNEEYTALYEVNERRLGAYNTVQNAVVQAGWVASGEPTTDGRVQCGPDACSS